MKDLRLQIGKIENEIEAEKSPAKRQRLKFEKEQQLSKLSQKKFEKDHRRINYV